MRIGSRVQKTRWVPCDHQGADEVWESGRESITVCPACCCENGQIQEKYGHIGTVIEIKDAKDEPDYGPFSYVVRWDTNEITEHVIVDLEDVTPRVYVNVYLHDRQYGGPEEGGWWYDVYEPVPEECVLADSEEDAVRIAEEKEEWADSENEGRRPPHSVLSEGHYVVRIEAWPAEFTPRTRPYYC